VKCSPGNHRVRDRPCTHKDRSGRQRPVAADRQPARRTSYAHLVRTAVVTSCETQRGDGTASSVWHGRVLDEASRGLGVGICRSCWRGPDGQRACLPGLVLACRGAYGCVRRWLQRRPDGCLIALPTRRARAATTGRSCGSRRRLPWGGAVKPAAMCALPSASRATRSYLPGQAPRRTSRQDRSRARPPHRPRTHRLHVTGRLPPLLTKAATASTDHIVGVNGA
jgi:hypothetical protein